MIRHDSFDFLAAVGFPMLVVSYCLSTFHFDRAKFAISVAVFPEGRFERQARLFADPVQMDVIDKSLNSLRIRTVVGFFTRVGTNLALFYQCRRLLAFVQQKRQPASGKANKPGSLYPTRHPVGLVFLAIPVFVCVFVYMSSSTATTACSVHPECVVFARRWTTLREGDAAQCPCLTLIAADEAPATFREWISPLNMTEKVGQLAATGDLQIIKLVNRQLPIFPEELRRCKNLKHLYVGWPPGFLSIIACHSLDADHHSLCGVPRSLQYTNTEALPAWTKEFTKLEYLYVSESLAMPARSVRYIQ